MSTARSAARRSVTGEAERDHHGCATPTTSSGPGCTATMPKAKDCAEGFGLVAAAWLIPAGPVARLAAIRPTASTSNRDAHVLLLSVAVVRHGRPIRQDRGRWADRSPAPGRGRSRRHALTAKADMSAIGRRRAGREDARGQPPGQPPGKRRRPGQAARRPEPAALMPEPAEPQPEPAAPQPEPAARPGRCPRNHWAGECHRNTRHVIHGTACRAASARVPRNGCPAERRPRRRRLGDARRIGDAVVTAGLGNGAAWASGINASAAAREAGAGDCLDGEPRDGPETLCFPIPVVRRYGLETTDL